MQRNVCYYGCWNTHTHKFYIGKYFSSHDDYKLLLLLFSSLLLTHSLTTRILGIFMAVLIIISSSTFIIVLKGSCFLSFFVVSNMYLNAWEKCTLCNDVRLWAFFSSIYVQTGTKWSLLNDESLPHIMAIVYRCKYVYSNIKKMFYFCIVKAAQAHTHKRKNS